MKVAKIMYWTSTGILSAVMILSAGLYFFNYSNIEAEFSRLKYPTYIIIPLGIAKLSAVTAILSHYNMKIVEWAYAGLFFNFLLAFSAHIHVQDGEYMMPLLMIVLLFLSYFFKKQVREINR